ncbi:MarR family transcriptional regulator [Actinobacteria bacterium YIM 96077]|uniref:MarR family transcriptional regulator n=1 Tax=Phytoactinopolyspora halophila TaxID=1981511 RepID=A0A329QHU4_9ACTN|nr:MarR family transcriptional regulator [Phytoactinopolyspora halophila]AYY15648.1 MarR family transcriptional regulator [Actinobacteria bacterium YIM 96077]RAW11943.1 MarR family transcriptional regulator [Phytoactinopolyspora halophila]
MSAPRELPIGIALSNTAKAVSRAFDEALSEAGGSRPIWLILMSLKNRSVANQRELADAVGIRGATLTHHLAAMEDSGLVTRRRDPANRRVHLMELTPEGEAAFLRLRDAAVTFDRALRAGMSDDEVGHLRELLDRLRANVAGYEPADDGQV